MENRNNEVSIKKVKPEMTQCRLVQLQKEQEKKNDKKDYEGDGLSIEDRG